MNFLTAFLVAAQGDAGVENALRQAVALYASFDETPDAEFAAGDGALYVRAEAEKGKFAEERGVDASRFRIAPGKGASGGALECLDLLPQGGRAFYRARGNLADRHGAVSVWVNTDPNALLKTRFCDPVQISQKGARNGGLWFDFTDDKPRDLRLGAFPAVPEGVAPSKAPESEQPIVRIVNPAWKSGEWHHVAISWGEFNTGRNDGWAALYIDGKAAGKVGERDLRMDWDLDQTRIYVALNFIGLLDELAVFKGRIDGRMVQHLYRNPGAIKQLLGVEGPVSAPLPAGVDPSKKWKLVRESDGRELPVQIDGGAAHWIGGSGKVRLEAGEPGTFPKVEPVVTEGRHATLRFAGRDVLRYNIGVVEAPAGIDPAHNSSGYIHPVWTPEGRVVSNDLPKLHPHHHGIWFCWRTGEFEGRKLNAFAPLEKLGRMEVVKVDGTVSGPVFGGFRARQRLVDLQAPGGAKPALEDEWRVRAYATDQAFVFDVDSRQSCASASPYTVMKNYYGGLGFRGSGDWEGKEGVTFLTSEGKTRLDGNGTAARWVVMNGKLAGKDAGLGLLCHPATFRAPQPTRLHPSEPFFCWVPGAESEFKVEPEKPVVSRYRFIVADRALSADEMKLWWDAYAEPSKGVVLSVKP